MALNSLCLSVNRTMAGVARYQLGLLQGLAAIPSGDEILALCSEGGKQLVPTCDMITKSVCLGMKDSVVKRCLWEHLLSPLRLNKLHVDLLHSTNFLTPFYVPCASVVTMHDLTYLSHGHLHLSARRAYHLALIGWSARRSQRIIAVSENTRKEIISRLNVPPQKVVAIYPGICTKQFRPVIDGAAARTLEEKYGLRRKQYVLYVGGVHPRKNVVTLVKAYKLLEKFGRLEDLVICGPRLFGNGELIAELERPGGGGRIISTGPMPDPELPALYSNAALMVYPSLYEGFGYPVVEAMACGTPVITSNVSSLPEAAGTAAILVDPLDVENLAQNMARVLSDTSLQNRLVADGKRHVRRFSLEGAARETLKVYGEALEFWRKDRK